MFLFMNLLLEYWIEHALIGLRFVNYVFLNIYSAEEFKALQLIVFVVFGAGDWPHASSVLVHFLEI